MLAFITSPIGRDCAIFLLILLILGGLYAYWQWSQSQIATLTANLATVQAQANDLAAAKAALETQVAQIAKDQDTANQSITKAETAAAAAQKALRAAQAQLAASAKTNPRALEKQINQTQAQQFQDLQALSQ